MAGRCLTCSSGGRDTGVVNIKHYFHVEGVMSHSVTPRQPIPSSPTPCCKSAGAGLGSNTLLDPRLSRDEVGDGRGAAPCWQSHQMHERSGAGGGHSIQGEFADSGLAGRQHTGAEHEAMRARPALRQRVTGNPGGERRDEGSWGTTTDIQ